VISAVPTGFEHMLSQMWRSISHVWFGNICCVTKSAFRFILAGVAKFGSGKIAILDLKFIKNN
jgi:hypothetical protein